MGDITAQEWIDSYVDIEVGKLVEEMGAGDVLDVLTDIGEGTEEECAVEDIAIELRKDGDYDPARVGRLLRDMIIGYHKDRIQREAEGMVPDYLD